MEYNLQQILHLPGWWLNRKKNHELYNLTSQTKKFKVFYEESYRAKQKHLTTD